MPTLLRILGIVLVLVGVFVCARAAVRAVGEFGAIYQAAADDPLAQPEVSETERGERMIGHVIGAAWGVPPLVAGGVLLAVSRAKRRRR